MIFNQYIYIYIYVGNAEIERTGKGEASLGRLRKGKFIITDSGRISNPKDLRKYVLAERTAVRTATQGSEVQFETALPHATVP